MVKPVDLQDSLSKTQLLEKIHQLQKSNPDEAQKQFASELQKKVADGKNKVTDLPKSDKIVIHREDDKKKNNRENSKKNKQKKQDDLTDDEKKTSKNIDYLA